MSSRDEAAGKAGPSTAEGREYREKVSINDNSRCNISRINADLEVQIKNKNTGSDIAEEAGKNAEPSNAGKKHVKAITNVSSRFINSRISTNLEYRSGTKTLGEQVSRLRAKI